MSKLEQVISKSEMENKIITLFEENGYSLSDARMVLQSTSMKLQYHSEVKLKIEKSVNETTNNSINFDIKEIEKNFYNYLEKFSKSNRANFSAGRS